MTLYRPNGAFGPVCDPFVEPDENSLAILFDATVLAAPSTVTVDLEGQSVTTVCVDTADYRPNGAMGPVCDPPPTRSSDGEPCVDLPGGIGSTDPRVVNPLPPPDDLGPVYSGPTEPYRPDGDFGPVCDPFVPYNINPEQIRDPDDDDDDGDEEQPDELDLVNPQPFIPPKTVAQDPGDYRPNGPFGPVCDPFVGPSNEAEDIRTPDLDPDTDFLDADSFPNGNWVPATVPTIGLPTTDAYEDGIDAPSIAGIAFYNVPFWGTSDINQIPASFTFDDPDPDKGDWDWTPYFYNPEFFEWDTTPVDGGRPGKDLYEYLIDLVENDPDAEGDTEVLDADKYCEEPWPDSVLDPYVDTNGNTVYRRVRSNPRTYQVNHETFCPEFAQKSAWISQGICSFEGNTRLAGNAANFTSDILIPETDTYTIRYKYVKRGELFLNYYDAPIVPGGGVATFTTRFSGTFTDPNTGAPDPDNSEGGSSETGGSWQPGNVGYRRAAPPGGWSSANDDPYESIQELIYRSNYTGAGKGARAKVRFEPWDIGDSNIYTKVTIVSILDPGSGYAVGERLTIPYWNTFSIGSNPAVDQLIRVESLTGDAQGSAPDTITLINAAEGASTYDAPPGMLLDFDTRSSAYFVNQNDGTICPDGCGDINGGGTWDEGKVGYRVAPYDGEWDNNGGFTTEEDLIYSSSSGGSQNGTGARARVRFSRHTVPGDSNEYTKVNVKAILQGGEGYEVGEILTIPTWNDEFVNSADRLIKVTSVAAQTSNDPCAFATKQVQIEKGTYYITAFVENYTIGSYKPHWKDSPAACAIEIFQGDFTQVTGQIPCDIGIQESTTAGSASFGANGDLVVTGTCRLKFDFSYNDNPNTYGTALGTVAFSEIDVSFTQDNSQDTGSGTATRTVGNGTYQIQVSNANSAGFVRQNNNTELCFRDSDGNDCNALLRVTTLSATPAGEGITYTCGTEAEVKLGLRYDDSVDTAGLCIESATWAGTGVTLNRNTNKEEGKRSATTDLLSGTYNLNLVGNEGGFLVENPGSTNNDSYIVLYDGGGSDENGRLTCELISSTGPNVTASFDSNGNLQITGSRGYTNSYVAGITDHSNVWSQSDVGTEITFTATDPSKGMSVQIGIVPRNKYDGTNYIIITEWAVKEVYSYGDGYSVDDTWNVSYTKPGGGTVSAKVKIFSTRRGNATVGNLVWSTTNNAVGYDESYTPFPD